MSSEESGEAIIQEAMQRREATDERMSGLWILVPLLGPILAIISVMSVILMIPNLVIIEQTTTEPTLPGFLGIFAILAIVSLIGMILTGYFIYKLIKRRNQHFKRSRILREGLLQLLEREKKGGDIPRMGTLRTIHAELNAREGEKSAGLLAILSVIFSPLTLYVQYILTDDYTKHTRRERIFFRNFADIARDRGMEITYPEWKQTPDRTAGLYLILTLVTGLFSIYWYWTLIKDPHTHYEAHKLFEDQLTTTIA